MVMITPNAYLLLDKSIQDQIDLLEERRAMAYEQALMATVPERLREATAEDVVVGAVLWYPDTFDEDADRKWNIVEEVYNPSDPFKGYCAHDGCQYGLDGAYVQYDDRVLA